MSWLRDNFVNIVLTVLIAGAVFLALRAIIKHKKQGKPLACMGCECGDSAHCAGCAIDLSDLCIQKELRPKVPHREDGKRSGCRKDATA